MRCFVCLHEFGNPEDLFTHVSSQHRNRNSIDYRCSLCLDVSEDFGSFKKHARRCFEKRNGHMEVQADENIELIDEAFDIYNDLAMECSDEISQFQETLEKAALELVVKMSANMSIPRDSVFKTISDFEVFIKTFNQGLKTLIIPSVRLEETHTVKNVLKKVEKSFKKFNTESKLDSVLNRLDLMLPLEQCLVLDESRELEGNMSMERSMTLMPISYQIRKLFELPKVFEKVEAHTNAIRSENKINHFINGALWKRKLEHYEEDDTVIPYFLYVDGAQVNNALGTHIATGEEQFNYMTFPTIPTEYQSRLENILVTSICPQICLKKLGVESVFSNVIEELVKLANEGLNLTINGQQKKVFFVCGAFIGDNKDSNIYLGFVRGFRACYYCRFCRMHRTEMEITTVEIDEERRNRQNYNDDVLTNNETLTGVREYSCLNEIPFFHVTDSTSEDLTHNLELGSLQYNLSTALYHLIFDNEDFTLDELNERIKLFDYSDEERQNIPMPILARHLEKQLKLKMTAAEMANFVHNLTFIIGDLVHEGDAVWDFVLHTIRFFDLCYMPCFTDDNIDELREVIDVMHDSYVIFFEKTLKPVHHFAIHYPTDIKNFGPLRYLRTIRCEAKHKPMKNYSKNTTNRINICYSMGKKVQYNFAHRLMESKGLEDIITAKICSSGSITSKIYYGKLEPSTHLENVSQQICQFTNKVIVNGMIFKIGLWLPSVPDSENRQVRQIHEICDIILLSSNKDDIFAVCKTYTSVGINQHYGCYVVIMDLLNDQFSVINISEFLRTHHYPVKAHSINGEYMFRCKRF